MNIPVKRKYLIMSVLLILSFLLFQNYYLAPKGETIREEIQVKYVTLQKYEAYLKGSGITDEEMQNAVKETKDAEQRLIAEKSEFLASAKMQHDITELAQGKGLIVQTLRPMNAVKQNKYVVVPIYFEGNGTIKQISDFLKAVEDHPVMFKVDKLGLSVTNMQNPRDLRFKIQLSGMSRI